MFQYIVRRVIQFIPVFLGVTLILFLIATYLPGADAVQLRAGEKTMSPVLKAKIRHQLGLDRAWYIQYGDYLSSLSPIHATYYDGSTPASPTAAPGVRVLDGAVALIIPKVSGPIPATGTISYDVREGVPIRRGQLGRFAIGSLAFEFDPPDLGVSLYNGRPVLTILSEAYPYTVRLAFLAIILEIIIGIGAGIVSAVKRYSIWDILVTLGTSILVSVPVFWLGLMLQYVFGIWLQDLTHGAFYLPVLFEGGATAPFPAYVYYILPAITLASVSTAYAARIMRSQLLEVNNQDYIRTAHAKGLSDSQVLWSHAIKNAMIPVVTYVGLDLGAMLAGAILTETVFNLPGIGYAIFKAIVGRDFAIVFGGVTLILLVVMVVNLLVDVSYAFLDPRIRYGGLEE